MNLGSPKDIYEENPLRTKIFIAVVLVALIFAVWFRFFYTPAPPAAPPINTNAPIFQGVTAISCSAAQSQILAFVNSTPGGLSTLTPPQHSTYQHDYLVLEKSCSSTAAATTMNGSLKTWLAK
jgi:hypothetical protein